MTAGYRRVVCLLGTLAMTLAAATSTFSSSSYLSGHSTASVNGANPMLGTWRYVLDVSWNTGSVLSLSHLNLIIDLPGGTCLCSSIVDDIIFAIPAGSTNGVPGGCTVEYDAYVNCNGDPSIPGVEGILFKWEPRESHGCEPGPIGSGTFVFYSNYPPAPVTSDLYLMVIKAGPSSLRGTITGSFPSLPCDPVTSEAFTWSSVKQRYMP